MDDAPNEKVGAAGLGAAGAGVAADAPKEKFGTEDDEVPKLKPPKGEDVDA